ncbi:MAG TPA: GntR family transcriptional regulator [Bacillota bacterium]
MKLQIEKEAGLPLYLQIKAQIKQQIERGILAPGEQLPTERELALDLGVSRNTVSQAFAELSEEGVIEVGQGKGTFVTEAASAHPLARRLAEGHKEKALRLIDLAIDECLDLGFSLADFTALATVRAREREDSLLKTRVLFIDCNQEQLVNFSREFRELGMLEVIPLLLSDFLEGGLRIGKLLSQVDLVVTTTTHQEIVAEKLKDLGTELELVPVAAQPRLESLIRISRLSGDRSIGLVCLSREFPEIVRRTLAKLNMYDLSLDYTTTKDPEELGQFIENHDLILVYADRYREVKALAGEKEIISYLHGLDRGSVTLVRRAVERIWQQKQKEGR